MTQSSPLPEDITFLDDEIKSLRARIGAMGNAAQRHKLSMFLLLRERCVRDVKALAKRDAAA